MSDNPFYFPMTAWRTNDVLSSTKLNQLIGNMDYVYGQDQRLVMGSVETPLSNDPFAQYEREPWTGYIAHTGDTIVYRFATPRAGRNINYNPGINQFRFDASRSGEQEAHIPDEWLHHLGTYMITQVVVENDLPNAEGADHPMYIYLRNSQDTAVSDLPTFVNGTVPTAAHFNKLITETENLRGQMDQPVGFARARFDGDEFVDNNVWPYYSRTTFYAPWRHTWFAFMMRFSSGNPQERSERLEWRVERLDTGAVSPFWQWDLYENHIPPSGVFFADLRPKGLTLDTWYAWTFTHYPWNADNYKTGTSKLYWAGQQRTETASNWAPMERWTLGDIVNGNAGGPPKLTDMTTNLAWLDTRRNSRNIVSRANMSNDYTAYNETFFSRRVHRWLAYDGTVTTPSLRYGTTTAPTLHSVSIPGTDGNYNLDLDSTPIRPGMMMYISGVKYAIQIPSVM